MPTSACCAIWWPTDMPIAYLDLNDSALRLWHADRVLESPGYALHEGQGYQFGAEARARARLRPRDVSTRFWWQLDTRPLQPVLGPARHSADLVHQHLQHLYQQAGTPGEWLLAAPGSMQDTQLSLLLGIIQQCPFRAVGLVHRSVALASLFRAEGPLFHLELQLHQALLTELHAGAGLVRLQRETVLPGCGLLQMQERLVETIARTFIRQTRFDPRRRAESEQQLYDALPGALESLQESPEAALEIQGHSIRIGLADLEDSCAALRDSVRRQLATHGAGGPLLLDPLAALLPGLQQALSGEALAADDLPAALAAQQTRLLQKDESLMFVSELPQLAVRPLALSGGETEPHAILHTAVPDGSASAARATPQPPLSTSAELPPTHLLHGYRARPLVDPLPLGSGWQIQRADRHWCLRQRDERELLQLNGQPARDGTRLHCGDHLQTSLGETFQLIAVGE